jgi:23S rRNA (uridine2552-2'-O)-methyltransferase
VANSYQKRDKYTAKAKAEGYEARSIYKLEQIDKKHPVIHRGDRVVDLGCYPGSWTRYAIQKVGRKGTVVGVDFTAPKVSGATFFEASALDVSPEQLLEVLGGAANTVLSDMAPPTTGDKTGDHYRQIELARRALYVAAELLEPGGTFVCKVFEGGDAQDFVLEARVLFKTVKRVRPDAVRKVSREWFLVATGFKGKPLAAAEPA